MSLENDIDLGLLTLPRHDEDHPSRLDAARQIPLGTLGRKAEALGLVLPYPSLHLHMISNFTIDQNHQGDVVLGGFGGVEPGPGLLVNAVFLSETLPYLLRYVRRERCHQTYHGIERRFPRRRANVCLA